MVGPHLRAISALPHHAREPAIGPVVDAAVADAPSQRTFNPAAALACTQC
mgnify:CR=1 FL=1